MHPSLMTLLIIIGILLCILFAILSVVIIVCTIVDKRRAKRDLKKEATPFLVELCWVFRDALEKGRDWNLAIGAQLLYAEQMLRKYLEKAEAIGEAHRIFTDELTRTVERIQTEECIYSRDDAYGKTAERILAETRSPEEEIELAKAGVETRVNLTPVDNAWNSLALYITHRARKLNPPEEPGIQVLKETENGTEHKN